MQDPRYQPPQHPPQHPNQYPQQGWNAGYDPLAVEREKDKKTALWLIGLFVVAPIVLIFAAGIGVALWIMSSVPR